MPFSAGHDPLDDETLARRLRDGDPIALEALHERYAPVLHRSVLARVGDASAAEDIVQTAFLRLWEHRETLRSPAGIRAWLRQTSGRLAVDHLRQRREESLDAAQPQAAPSPAPDEHAEARDAEAAYRAALAMLEERHRRVIELLAGDGMSSAEVAVALGVGRRRASILVYQARSALRRAMRTALLESHSPCAKLRALLPSDGRALRIGDRVRIDHHSRRCDACRVALASMPRPEDALLALPLPFVAHLVKGGGLSHTAAGGAHGRPAPHVSAAQVAAVAVAGVVAASAVMALLLAHGQPSRHPLAVEPLASRNGRVLVTGGDEDAHAHAGANRAGARHFIQRALAYVERGRRAASILLVTDLHDPHDGVRVDPRIGLREAGLTFDIAAAGPQPEPALALASVQFSRYDVVIVASDYGGWLRQAEIDTLISRRSDLVAFVRGGGGLVVFSEGGGGDPRAARTTTGRWYAFLGNGLGAAALTQPGDTARVSAAGAAAGFAAEDERGNFVHTVFRPPSGATALEILPDGVLTLDDTQLFEGR